MLQNLIVPAILEKTPQGIEEKLDLVKGLTKYIQIDIIDNWPKGEKTVSLAELDKINKLHDFDFEIHLMVKEPINYLPDCQKLGAKMIYGQIEFMSDQKDFIRGCHRAGIKAGLALDLPTFFDKIDSKNLFGLDGILLMSVEAGAQGKLFSRKMLGKLKRLVRIKKTIGTDFIISIDGGINLKTGKWCKANGAQSLNVGSFLLKSENVREAWQQLNLLISPAAGQ